MSAGRLLVGKGKWGPVPLLPQGTQRAGQGPGAVATAPVAIEGEWV